MRGCSSARCGARINPSRWVRTCSQVSRSPRTTALAGWARTQRGREVVFALISNGHRHGDVEAIAAADAFAAALVNDDR